MYFFYVIAEYVYKLCKISGIGDAVRISISLPKDEYPVKHGGQSIRLTCGILNAAIVLRISKQTLVAVCHAFV